MFSNEFAYAQLLRLRQAELAAELEQRRVIRLAEEQAEQGSPRGRRRSSRFRLGISRAAAEEPCEGATSQAL
jgi:hypothetical protein